MLHLVPRVRGGRWLFAAVVFAGMLTIFVFAIRHLQARGDDIERVFSYGPALFFCAIIAYIVPVFDYITARTEQAVDDLRPHLDLPAAAIDDIHASIARKPVGRILRTIVLGVVFWLLQSWLLAGGWRGMLYGLQHSPLSFLVSTVPLLVWLTLTTAVFALIDNARVFRRLTAHVRSDLLDPSSVSPFGAMAVYSTLVVIGAQACFPLMWVSGPINAWTTVPGVVMMLPVTVMLLLMPLLPLQSRLRAAKHAALEVVQTQVNERRQSQAGAPERDPVLHGMLAYRHEITSVSEWPVDFAALMRLLSYAVIVPLTWIGAALIEMLVNQFVN